MTATVSTISSPAPGPDTPDLSPLWTSVQRTHEWEPRPVEGTLPEALRTTVIRTGPGLIERFGRRLPHSFEADGVMMALRLRGDGQAQGAVRIVESPGYRAEQAAGKPLFGALAPWWRRFLNGLRRRTKATGNTSMMHWQGQVYALMEGARPVQIDPHDLSTGDTSDLGGVVGATFSAHPHRLDQARTTINFGVTYGPKPSLTLYALPDQGPARPLGAVPLPWNTMVHDFAVTERYAVFLVCPLMFSLGRALLAPRDLRELFEWTPSAGAQVLVVPLDDAEHPKVVSLPARFVFHLANAQQRGDALLVDWVQYTDATVMTALSGDGAPPKVEPSTLQRVEIDLRTGAVLADAPLWDHGCDFPVLPATRVGHGYDTLWLMTAGDDHSRGIARLEPETGTVDAWRPGPGIRASEPLFVPRPEATRDDEGWLVSLVLDGWRSESFFGIFDADRPSDGPLCRVWMGQALPTTFHGTLVP